MNPGSAEWLFRQGELVLGPVSAEVIIEKLYAGEADARTQVSKMSEGQWRPLNDFDVFKVHVAKAQAKARVDKLAVSEDQKRKRNRNIKIGIASGIAAAVAVAMGIVGYRIATDNPFKSVDQEAFGDITISIEPGEIGLARAHHEDEELIDYPIGGQKTQKSSGTAVAKKENDEKPSGTKLASAKPPKSNKVNDESDDPDGMQTAKFDQSAINAVVASSQKTLYPCLIAEAQKNPGLSAKIPIEFVIGNDGKVQKVWVDYPAFKTGPLPDCLLQKLQTWKFKPYDGERATVSLSFKIGKNG